ncbi:response regulator transcription factor [Trichloromonas sp.]|uniref:response regulator transcription factor n=1 Tax=Trichloromonas sp. TaxID=3069249 RepID=UPI003D8193CB
MTMRILAIDDEADVLHLLEVKLTKAGYQVTTARDGEEGVAKALAERPDLMIVDVMMPKKDGYQVVAEVKAQLGPQAPVILLLTARGQEADVIKGLSGGADDYIIKPFSPRELIERVKVALIRKGKLATP